MKTTLLNGFTDPQHPVAQALLRELHARGDAVTDFTLANTQIADCMGDFHCWVRYPGTCAIHDSNHDVARAVIESDLTIFLTPVTFGGYSSTLKKAVDHLIQNVLPFFTRVDGEVHHARRYQQYPRLLIIGWLPAPEPAAAAESVFRYLAERNAINFHASRFACGILHGDQPAEETLRELLARAEKERCPKKPALLQDLLTPDSSKGIAPRKVTLLVGSPRGPKSTSASLGNYLLQGLAARGIQTESTHAHFALRQPDRLTAALDTIAQSDLLAVAFPLYVDSLPAALIRFLEALAERGAQPGQGMLAITNCGFPEADHNRPALSICRQFALETGRSWMGGLALGAGEGIVHQQPLEEGGGRTFSIRSALDMSAEALAAGRPVSAKAVALLAKLIIPNQVYIWMGAVGWKQQAKHWGAEKRMKERPYIG